MDILTLQFGADAEPEPLLETDANEAVNPIERVECPPGPRF